MFKIKIIIILAAAILIGTLITGCSPLISDDNSEDDVPLFPGDTSQVQAKEYMLYFGLLGEEYLAAETRTLTIPESKSIEETLIRKLISGPEGNSGKITSIINENTRLISVKGNEDVLFVSLSEHFLTPPAGLGKDIDDPFVYEALVSNTRRLALYSIANTITELGRYSFVQFYIDYDNNGTAIRPTRQEMGFLGEGENQLIEPLFRNTDVIFSPTSSVHNIMTAINDKNWAKVMEYTSLAESPDETIDEKTRQLELSNLSLLEYSIINDSVSLNGKSAIVLITYTFETADGTPSLKENVSVKMVLEDGIWKCSIVSINQILLGEYE